MTVKLPPLGVPPERVWLQLRIQDLLDAVGRYANSPYSADPCVVGWLEEIKRHVRQLADLERT